MTSTQTLAYPFSPTGKATLGSVWLYDTKIVFDPQKSELESICFVGTPYWLDKAIQKLKELKNLGTNWNSYNGLAIDKDLIAQAEILLRSVKILEKDIPEPFIAPVSSGGINIEWDTPSRYLSIKIRHDGVRFFCVKKDENEVKEKGRIEEDSLDSVLSLLK